MTVHVQLRAITRAFDGGGVRALDGVDLRILAREFVAVMGPSGSGKSSLLNILGLLDRPSGGSYLLGETLVEELDDDALTRLRSRHIGFVFQAFHLLAYKTVQENVELSLAYAGMPRRDRAASAEHALTKVAMQHRAAAYPPTLSGGERQRVAIARAWVRNPAMLLCDEPTGNLDSESSESVLALLTELNDAGQTIVVVTHDAAVAAQCGRIVSMRDGRVVSDSAPVPNDFGQN